MPVSPIFSGMEKVYIYMIVEQKWGDGEGGGKGEQAVDSATNRLEATYILKRYKITGIRRKHTFIDEYRRYDWSCVNRGVGKRNEKEIPHGPMS